MARTRLTWKGNRAASAPPAVPGYDFEDQDHPAHQKDPAHGDYAKGSPSEWAEDPRRPPYPQGNPPANPGYDFEDQDHPAHTSPPRVPKSARGLQATIMALTEAKAAKCLRAASAMLRGRRGVTAKAIQDQAFVMMDWSDKRVDAALERHAGGFLAEELDFEEEVEAEDFNDPSFMADDELDALLAEDDIEGVPVEGNDMMMLAAEVRSLRAQLNRLAKKAEEVEEDEEDEEEKEAAKKAAARRARLAKKAEEDEAKEEEEIEAKKASHRAQMKARLAKKAEEEVEEEEVEAEEEVEEEKESSKKASTKTAAQVAARAFFASMDTDGDGFVIRAEWLGPQSLFAAADKDKDDIVSEDEVVEEMTGGKKACGEEVATLNPEETAMLAEMEFDVEEEVPAIEGDDFFNDDTSVQDAGLFSKDDAMGNAIDLSDEDDAILSEIFGGRKAKKSEDEEEEVEAEEEVVEEEDTKKAALAARRAKALKAKKAEDEEVVEEEVEASKKKASRTAGQRPQPRKPSTGVSRVGSVSAQASGEVAELSKLWQSAPDVSGIFNGK